MPHYYVVINRAGGHTFSGSMNFRYQDGQSTIVFTFVGVGVGNNAVLTAKPQQQVGSASSTSSGRTKIPSNISVALGGTTIEFGECLSYLKFATSYAQCTFKSVPGA